jgi:hypothetical protein
MMPANFFASSGFVFEPEFICGDAISRWNVTLDLPVNAPWNPAASRGQMSCLPDNRLQLFRRRRRWSKAMTLAEGFEDQSTVIDEIPEFLAPQVGRSRP